MSSSGAKFQAIQQPDGSERIELHQAQKKGLLKREVNEIIQKRFWTKLGPRAGLSALIKASSFDPNDEIIELEDAVILPPSIPAQLNDIEAKSLGLPPATNLILELKSSGSLHKGDIQVQTRWVQHGGVPARADQTGCRLRQTGKIGRLVEPLYSTLRSVKKIEEAKGPDAKRAAFAELKDALGSIVNDRISPDGYMQAVRVAYAANFSLDVKTSGGYFDFDPVLFSKSVNENPEGDLIDEKDASLLTEEEAQRFKRRFRGQSGGQRSYLLSDGTLLYLDPLLGQALDIIRDKQQSSPGEKREFLKSPQRVLREGLDLDELDNDEAADQIFIETLQFSERVGDDISIWQKPILPWLKTAPNSWLPESFGIRIGDVYLPIEPSEAAILLKGLEEAREQGKPTFEYQGTSVPTSEEAKKAIQAVAEAGQVMSSNPAPKPNEEPSEEQREVLNYFLEVDENFDELEYSKLTDTTEHFEPFSPPPLPSHVKSEPKTHQIQAFNWLVEAWSRKSAGVLLADDMGLGKTYQSLTFITWVRRHAAPDKPVLIVAPTGLLRNWQEEINLHLTENALGEVVEAFGANLGNIRNSKGTDIQGGTSNLDVSRWSAAGVVLTTYETMRDYHMSFASVPFSVIVFDEIQKLKNPASQLSRASKALNARLEIGMTGTPVENRLQDLWSISDTLYPGFLGSSRTFETEYGSSGSDLSALKSLQTKLVEPQNGRPPFMLRRMKEEILSGLPAKKVVTYKVEMPKAQADAYDRILARARALKGDGSKGSMLKVLHLMRGTSLHPKPPHMADEDSDYIASSARLRKTFEILDEIKDRREKALIFCEDLDMQAYLSAAISDRYAFTDQPFCINGKVAGTRRQQMVSEFQGKGTCFDVMILSPKAGGVGLTITAANHVIHLSRWWNPAVEDQATDRVYRIGQTKPVTVHLPLAIHPDATIGPSSFDLRLHELMQRKRDLSRGLLLPPESQDDVTTIWDEVFEGKSVEKPSSEVAAEKPELSADFMRHETAGLSENQSSAPEHESLETQSDKSLEKQSAERDLEHISPTPIEVGEKRAPDIRRIVYEPNKARDYTIFKQYLSNQDVQKMEIVDPYCCADERARGRLITFINLLSSFAQKIEKVSITAFDARSANSEESNELQWADLNERFKRQFPDIQHRFDLRAKTYRGDLHDRYVIAFTASGAEIIWDLGRGIDGVMYAKNSCIVNATLVN